VRHVLFSWQPPNPDTFSRQRSVIHHSREHVSTAVECSGGALYTTTSNALHCTWRCKAWMQLLDHGNLFYEVLYALLLC
ncbi:unnamed protein product, partial [Staurois parvus]